MSWNCSIAAANFPAEGSYVEHVITGDNVGNQDLVGASATFVIDRSKPVVTITGPARCDLRQREPQSDTTYDAGCAANQSAVP